MRKCAAIQMASSPSVSANLLEAEKLIAEAVKAGAKLVALPENFAIMGMSISMSALITNLPVLKCL